MSRCFPFPPPGYVWNGVSGCDLEELLKVRRERVMAEKERKKEKRKRNREKKKESEVGECLQRHNYGSGNKGREGREGKKRKVRETQGLENSSLTEEAGLPVTPNSQYDSSDNSHNVKKMKPSWSPHGHHCKMAKGNIIESDFQLNKHEEKEVTYSEPFLHTPTNSNVIREEYELASRPNSTFLETTPAHQRKLGPSCYHNTELLADEKAERVLSYGFSDSDSQFRELIVNWTPPRTKSDHTDFDDQEWLYEKNLSRHDVSEKSKASNDDMHGRSSMSYTCAPYLSQVDVYVLPYTLLF